MGKEQVQTFERKDTRDRDVKVLLVGAVVSALFGANPLAIALLGAAAIRALV